MENSGTTQQISKLMQEVCQEQLRLHPEIYDKKKPDKE